MKKILLLLLLPLVAACDRDNDTEPTIVYKEVNASFSYGSTALELDINNDGTKDVQFGNTLVGDSRGSHTYFYISTTGEHELLLNFSEEDVMGSRWVSGVEKDAPVTDNSAAMHYWTRMNGYILDLLLEKDEVTKVYEGPLVNKPDIYVGVRLRSGGKINYGWIHLKYTLGQDKVQVLAYAYNPVTGKEIKAGKH